MRYENWDVLLFPKDDSEHENAISEFQVSCHVVKDPEFSVGQGMYGLPTVCCFVPSLPAGTPFKVSILSRSPAIVSQYTKLYNEFLRDVHFEVRILIDGCPVASSYIQHNNKAWPQRIENSFRFSKSGELSALTFPSFRPEILQQSHWNAHDDLGRIKIVLSEVISRKSPSVPVERLKNLVAFSFQHAPLEILENSAIAWPNPTMWNQTHLAVTMPVPILSFGNPQSHAHAHRGHKTDQDQFSRIMPGGAIGQPLNLSGNFPADPFGGNDTYFDWLSNMGISTQAVKNGACTQPRGKRNETDESMLDYMPSVCGTRMSSASEKQKSAGILPTDENDIFPQSIIPPHDGPSLYSEAVPVPSSFKSALVPKSAKTTTAPVLKNSQAFQIPKEVDLTINRVRARKDDQDHRSTLIQPIFVQRNRKTRSAPQSIQELLTPSPPPRLANSQRQRASDVAADTPSNLGGNVDKCSSSPEKSNKRARPSSPVTAALSDQPKTQSIAIENSV